MAPLVWEELILEPSIGEPRVTASSRAGEQMPEGGGSIRSACGRVNRPIIAVCKHLHTLSPLQTGWV